MSSARVIRLVTALFAVALLAPVAGAQQASPRSGPPAPKPLEMPVPPPEPTVERLAVEHARISLADGATLAIGQVPPSDSFCDGGPFPWIARFDAQGAMIWERRGAQLFDGSGDVDPRLLIAGSVRDVLEAADGTLYLTGDVREGWQEADGTVRHRRDAFVVRLDAAGVPLRDRLLSGPIGPVPETPPPCHPICEQLPDPDFDDCAGRAITKNANVVVASECRAAGATDSDVMASKLTADLATLKWNQMVPRPGAANPFDVAIGPDNEIWITGEEATNAFLTNLRVNGTPIGTQIGEGPCGDAGEVISIEDDVLTVSGRFVDYITFDTITLDGGGEEQTSFEVDYDRTTFEMMNARAIAQPAVPPGSPARAPVGDSVEGMAAGRPGQPVRPVMPINPPEEPMHSLEEHQPVLVDVEVLVGKLMTGGPAALIETGEGKVFGVQGIQIDPEDPFRTALIRFVFQVHEMAPVIEEIALKLFSQYCTTAHFAVGGGNVGTGNESFLEAGSAQICADDESIVTAHIRPEVNQALGFAGEPPAPLDLILDLTLEFFDLCLAPNGYACSSTGGQNGSMDSIVVTSDYPN